MPGRLADVHYRLASVQAKLCLPSTQRVPSAPHLLTEQSCSIRACLAYGSLAQVRRFSNRWQLIDAQAELSASWLNSMYPLARQARLFAEAGVTKIRLTGGEPTLRKDIVPLTAALSGLPGVRDVGITTNAIALRRKLEDLQTAGTLLDLRQPCTGVALHLVPAHASP